MPRNRRSRRRGRRSRGGAQPTEVAASGGERASADKIVTVSGTCGLVVTCIVSASSQAAVAVRPASIGSLRLADQDALYRLFRFTDLRISAGRAESGGSFAATTVLGYVPALATTIPTTVDEVYELSKVARVMPGQTIPCELHLTRRDMLGPASWFVTQSGATDPIFDSQGEIIVSAESDSTQLAVAAETSLFIVYTCQFTAALDPGSAALNWLKRRGPDGLMPFLEQAFPGIQVQWPRGVKARDLSDTAESKIEVADLASQADSFELIGSGQGELARRRSAQVARHYAPLTPGVMSGHFAGRSGTS